MAESGTSPYVSMSQAMISGGKVAIKSLDASSGPTAENYDTRAAIRRSDEDPS